MKAWVFFDIFSFSEDSVKTAYGKARKISLSHLEVHLQPSSHSELICSFSIFFILSDPSFSANKMKPG